MPAYNAEKTLVKTYNEIPKNIVDKIILTDDGSRDSTVKIAKGLDIITIEHQENRGYGANLKTCFTASLKLNPDIIIVLHPDYQYPPSLIKDIVDLISSDKYDVVLASRMTGNNALKEGMPIIRYISNIILTFMQNILLGQRISEFHTGYRGYNANIFKNIPFKNNSNDFLFDNELLAQTIYFGYRIGEISCPAKYSSDSSSINFRKSLMYAFGVFFTSIKFILQKLKIKKSKIFEGIN